ncbi:MAG TPA: regulatory signaling modulator protein AmpE [Gammaproteobacteria bacterium]|nr:regulatory signaling modulator protein AmpE [Gammaproteobacteria bacterium]
MIFIVVLVALLIERFFDWSHLRQWGWFGACERFVMQKIPGGSPYLVLAASIVPFMFAAGIGHYLFADVLYGFPWLLVQLAVVLYCFGPKNLWADSFAAMNAVSKGDAQAAADKLQSTFQVSVSQPEALQKELINQLFISANQRIFAVVFWYVILGLPGALLYRLVAISSQVTTTPEINSPASTIMQILDWLPVRIFSFLFALGGNFTRVFTSWRKHVSMGLDGNDVLLSECGLAAVSGDSENLPRDGSLEKSAIGLLDRVFVIVLIIVLGIALVT